MCANPRMRTGSGPKIVLHTAVIDCAGDVMFADMKSENGRPAGYGTVRFKHPDHAMKAISILCCVTSRIPVCKCHLY